MAAFGHKPQRPPCFVLLNMHALDARPLVGPTRRASGNNLEQHIELVRSPHERVQRRLIRMDPWRRELLVEESPAEPYGAVETAVLVEGKKGFSVRLDPAAKLSVIAVVQVLAQNLLAGEGMADAARALNKQASCNLERPPSLVELLRLLWRPEVCKTTPGRVEMQGSQKPSHIDCGDDVVGGKFLPRLADLIADQRGDFAPARIDKRNRFGLRG